MKHVMPYHFSLSTSCCLTLGLFVVSLGCSQSSEQATSQSGSSVQVLPESVSQNSNVAVPQPEYELWKPLEHGIFIATEDGGRAIQAQVLVGVAEKGRVKIGAKEMSFSQVPQELLAIREYIRKEVKLSRFVMVMDIKDDDASESSPGSMWGKLQKLSFELDLWMTPCGIDNFRQ